MALGGAGAVALSGVARRVFSASADPIPLVLTAALLGLVALAACWTPAYRAARLDPARVLRED
jgi:ABC-type lipoprotein release transport system permease subunit